MQIILKFIVYEAEKAIYRYNSYSKDGTRVKLNTEIRLILIMMSSRKLQFMSFLKCKLLLTKPWKKDAFLSSSSPCGQEKMKIT